MDKITVENVPPYDGEYELDISQLTNLELRRIKLLTDIRAGEVVEAILRADSDITVGLAIVAVERQMSVEEHRFWEAKIGDIQIKFGGDDDDPPALDPPTTEPKNGGGPSANVSSGEIGTSPSESNQQDPSPTGPPDSQKSAISAQEISAI